MSVSFSLAGIYCFLQYFSQVSSGMASHRPHRQARAEAVPSTSAVSVQQGRVCGVSFFFLVLGERMPDVFPKQRIVQLFRKLEWDRCHFGIQSETVWAEKHDCYKIKHVWAGLP